MKKGILFLYTWLIIKVKGISRILGTQRTDRFAIVCMPRSGSVLLHTHLNSHLNILSYGEILRREYESSGVVPDVYQATYKNHNRIIKTVGLKLFYHFYEDEVYGSSFNQVIGDKSIKIIHLKRKDSLRQFVSLKMGERTGVFSSTEKSTGDVKPKIHISKSGFETYLVNKENMQQKIKELFAEHEVFEMHYEDFIKNKEETLKELQSFLGVRQRTLFSLLQKQNPEPLEELVENVHEFN